MWELCICSVIETQKMYQSQVRIQHETKQNNNEKKAKREREKERESHHCCESVSAGSKTRPLKCGTTPQEKKKSKKRGRSSHRAHLCGRVLLVQNPYHWNVRRWKMYQSRVRIQYETNRGDFQRLIPVLALFQGIGAHISTFPFPLRRFDHICWWWYRLRLLRSTFLFIGWLLPVAWHDHNVLEVGTKEWCVQRLRDKELKKFWFAQVKYNFRRWATEINFRRLRPTKSNVRKVIFAGVPHAPKISQIRYF